MLGFADWTGEALAGELGPRNATGKDAADLLGILDRGIRGLPIHIRAGHHRGDDPERVERLVVVRSDSAGGPKVFAAGCRSRNIGFQVVARRQVAVSAAIAIANEDPKRWEKALDQDGTETEHVRSSGLTSWVCEVTCHRR